MNGPYRHCVATVLPFDAQPFGRGVPGTMTVLAKRGERGLPVEPPEPESIWWACPMCGLASTIELKNAEWDPEKVSLKPGKREWFGPSACCGTRFVLRNGWWIWDGAMPTEGDLVEANAYRTMLTAVAGELDRHFEKAKP